MSGLPEQRTALLAGDARGIDVAPARRCGCDVTEHRRHAAQSNPVGRGAQPQARFVFGQVPYVVGGPTE